MTKALQYDQFGGSENLILRELPETHAGENEIRVHVTAVGLNPMDWLIPSNPQLAANFNVQLPQTFAYDFAGVVDEVGSSVIGFKVGNRVFGSSMTGAAAEHIVLPLSSPQLFHTPDAISDKIASTLTIAGLTAAVALRNAHVNAKDTLLIGGAAGGVGVFATQLARLIGAKVIGTASDSTRSFLQSLGAEQISYGDGLSDRLRDEHITAAIDLFSHEALHSALALGVSPDKMATIIMFPEPPAGVSKATGGAGTVEDMKIITDAIVAGKLTVPIAAEFLIDEFADAVKLQMSRHTHGKIVLTL
ncbi:NADP-dependent oxidoreductase [Lactococcus nasutitermitis]|uniref:NADP-dependent oxidoreductase n=1 Tax=Lactococcus nasutitermitis TaxID=1652957 RepID=A0ABV9JFQ4_9LACT|nr:NADP-dependent oxidoreductase [Lactococcus nasutitermitis]